LDRIGQAEVAMITPSSERTASSRFASLLYSRSLVRTCTQAFLNAGRPLKSSTTGCKSAAAGQVLCFSELSGQLLHLLLSRLVQGFNGIRSPVERGSRSSSIL